MSKYFKIIGAIELTSFVIGIIAYIVYMAKVFKDLGSNVDSQTAFTVFITIFLFLVLLFFGPALGLAFLCLGTLWESKTVRYTHVVNPASFAAKRAPAQHLNNDNNSSNIVINNNQTMKTVKEEPKPKLSLGKAVKLKQSVEHNGVVVPKGTYGTVYDFEYTSTPTISFTRSGKTIKIPVSVEDLEF